MARTDEPDSESRASTSLVDALESDPFYAAITQDISDDTDRREALNAYFRYSMREGAALGRCTVLADDDRGAAVWVKPMPPGVRSRSSSEKHRFLESILGSEGLANYDRIIGFMSPRSEQAVGSTAWYLSILGVSPEAQGRGLGTRLLEPTLREADTEGADCYLETYSLRSVSFYERLGFRRIASYTEPVTSCEYWIMIRSPIEGVTEATSRPAASRYLRLRTPAISR